MGKLSSRLGNAWVARTSRFARPAKAFVAQPEPKSIGSPTQGIQLLSGNLLFAGKLVEAPEKSIWDAGTSDRSFLEQLHGFGWLDHLVAEASKDAQAKSKDWLWQWIQRYGNGSGPGWQPHLTGRRVVRWVNHALFLLEGQSQEQSKRYFKSLGHQAKFLSKRWRKTEKGLPRFEALIGLVYCGLTLETKRNLLDPALRALGDECKSYIAGDGSIPSRNPEELMQIFVLLTWAAKSLDDARQPPNREHLLAMERIVPTIRALRLGGGGLASFHGGGRGAKGLLDQTLADASIRIDGYPLGGMGYSRLSQSGTTLIVDTMEKPVGPLAHDSPLGFEMSSSNRLVLVNIGPGQKYGGEWSDVAKQLTAHNCISILGRSPELNSGRRKRRIKTDPPTVTLSENEEFQMLAAKQSVYVPLFGLGHYRSLDLSRDGRLIRGRDRLVAEDPIERKTFDNWMARHSQHSLQFGAHFHISPDVTPEIGLAGRAVSLALPDGSVWVFQVSDGKIGLQDSAAVEPGRLNVRATKQIVVTSDVANYEGTIAWSLTRN